MAEGWAKALRSDIDSYSAGIEAHGLNPNAVAVMKENGIDISGQKSQLLSDFSEIKFDKVVTLCGHADENCPVFPGVQNITHVPFDDPPKLAAEVNGEDKKLDCYRTVCMKIRDFVQESL